MNAPDLQVPLQGIDQDLGQGMDQDLDQRPPIIDTKITDLQYVMSCKFGYISALAVLLDPCYQI